MDRLSVDSPARPRVRPLAQASTAHRAGCDRTSAAADAAAVRAHKSHRPRV